MLKKSYIFYFLYVFPNFQPHRLGFASLYRRWCRWSEECSTHRLSEGKADPRLSCRTSQQHVRMGLGLFLQKLFWFGRGGFFSWASAYLKVSLQSSLHSCCWGISGKKRKQQESLGQQGFICGVNHRACANVRMFSRLSLTLREFCFSVVSQAPCYRDKERCRNGTLNNSSPLNRFIFLIFNPRMYLKKKRQTKKNQNKSRRGTSKQMALSAFSVKLSPSEIHVCHLMDSLKAASAYQLAFAFYAIFQLGWLKHKQVKMTFPRSFCMNSAHSNV